MKAPASALRLLMAVGWAIAVSAADPAGDAPSPADAFNYVAGTQTFGPAYQFTGETRLIETAKRIRELGSTVIKFDLSKRYADAHGNVPAPNAAIRSLTSRGLTLPNRRWLATLTCSEPWPP